MGAKILVCLLQHVQLRFEAEQMDDEVIEDFPAILRMKVSLALYKKTIEDCFLFKNCSKEFMGEVVSCSHTFKHCPWLLVTFLMLN